MRASGGHVADGNARRDLRALHDGVWRHQLQWRLVVLDHDLHVAAELGELDGQVEGLISARPRGCGLRVHVRQIAVNVDRMMHPRLRAHLGLG